MASACDNPQPAQSWRQWGGGTLPWRALPLPVGKTTSSHLGTRIREKHTPLRQHKNSLKGHHILFLTGAGTTAWRDVREQDKSGVHSHFLSASRSTSVINPTNLTPLFPLRKLSLD
ncbi:uncharacterized protein ACIB01_006125 [Guaruba guarouba]